MLNMITKTLRYTGLLLLLGSLGLFASTSASAQADLAKRIQAIEDRIEIEELIMGIYPRALDSSNWKAYAATFAKEGMLVQGDSEVKGPAAIEANFNRPGQAPPVTDNTGAEAELRIGKHIISDLTITLESDTRARASAYWQTVFTRGKTTTIAGAGHYNDVLIKEDGHWRFLRREIVNPLRN